MKERKDEKTTTYGREYGDRKRKEGVKQETWKLVEGQGGHPDEDPA